MRPARILAVLSVVFCLGAANALSAQTLWSVDGSGLIDTEAGPLPVWDSGRAYLTEYMDAALQVRQIAPSFFIDYNVAGYLRYTSERQVSADLTQLNGHFVLHQFPGSLGTFEASLGRLPLVDPTSIVLTQDDATGVPAVDPKSYVFDEPGDGLSLGIGIPGFAANLTVAYLGLLLKNTNTAWMTPDDSAALADSAVVLAPSRGVGMLSLSTPDLLWGTDLSIWGMYFLGFNGTLPEGRWYAGISSRGPIWGPISERVVLVTGAELAAAVSLLGSFAVLADLPAIAASQIEGEVVYASGEGAHLSSFLPLTGYRPFTPDAAGVIFDAPYENLVRLAVEYSIRPFWRGTNDWYRPIAPFLASRTYFAAASPTEVLGFTPPGSFYGSELEVGVAYRHNADPGVSLSGGFFVDADGGLQWFGRTSLTASF